MKNKLDRITKAIIIVLFTVNLLLQACCMAELHRLRQAEQQNTTKYFCGNYYLDHNREMARELVLYPQNGEGIVRNGGIAAAEE